MQSHPSARAHACALLAAALWAGVAPAPSTAQGHALGPLTAEEGSPLQRLSFTPMTEVADPVAAGTLRTDVWLAFSNVFEQDSAAAYELYFDMERLISTATVRYGLAEGLEVGGRLGFETTGGGVLDDFLTWWHGILHVGNADREKYPSGTYRQRLEDGGGRVRIAVPQRTLALDDVRLFAKLRLVETADRGRALSLRAVARIPAADGQVGRELADGALIILGRASWTRWHVHGMVSGSTVRAAPELEDLLAGSAWLTSWSVERNLGERLSAILQYSLATPRIRAFDSKKIGAPVGNVVLGAAGRFGTEWRWDVSFQEDVPQTSPAIDFTLGVRVSRSW